MFVTTYYMKSGFCFVVFDFGGGDAIQNALRTEPTTMYVEGKRSIDLSNINKLRKTNYHYWLVLVSKYEIKTKWL